MTESIESVGGTLRDRLADALAQAYGWGDQSDDLEAIRRVDLAAADAVLAVLGDATVEYRVVDGLGQRVGAVGVDPEIARLVKVGWGDGHYKIEQRTSYAVVGPWLPVPGEGER